MMKVVGLLLMRWILINRVVFELRILGNEIFINGVSYINVVDSDGYPYATGCFD